MLRVGADLYIERRKQERKAEKAEAEAAKEARRQEREQKKAAKEAAAKAEWQQKYGYDPETDRPKYPVSHADVIIPEKLEPKDYRREVEESKRIREEALQKRAQQKEAEEKQRQAGYAMQQQAYEQAQGLLKRQEESGSIWVSNQINKMPRPTIEMKRDAALLVEAPKKFEQSIPHELLIYDTFGDLRRRYPDHDDYIAALERERDARRNRRALKIAHK